AIYQADICAGSNAAVISSVTEVGNSSTGFIRTLQLGPDGKLYFTRFAQNWIGVIDNPNLAAPSCGFNVNGVQLSAGAQCKAGLANFNQSFFRQQVPFGSSSSCLNVSFNTNAINQAASCLNPIQSYSWLFGDPSTGASNISSSANPSHTYSSPGTYSVRLIINYLCSADTLFQNVTANCGPQLQVSDGIVCSGACYSLQASTVGGTPPYSYSWNSGIGSGSGPHSVCPGVTSNYIVTVTDASGLTDQDTVTVTVSSINPYTLTTNSVSCNGGSNGSAQISLPGGPYTYQWIGFPSNTSTSLSNVPAGNYSFIISNQAGCHKNGSVTISQPLPITATIATHPAACSQANGSASVSVSGGVAPYSYSWLGFSQTGSILNGVAAGNYSLTITDANNCSTTVNFSINSASGPLASVQLNSPVNCHGGNSGSLTALSSGGQAPLSYAWSNGQTSATISNLSAGTYSVTITDANSCQSTDTYTLIDPVAISTTLVTQSATCSLANGSASINVSGAVSPIQVNWATSPAQSGTTATNLIAGNYSVLVTDANGCYASTNFTIGNLPGALVSISSTPMSCSGANDATVTVSVITSGSYQVNWNTGQTSTQLNSVGAGTYTATVTTAAGCISTVSQVISSPSPLTLNFSSSPASCGSANGSLIANVSGGFAPYTFSWVGYSSVNAANLPNLLAGTYPLTVTDSHGCTISGNASVSSLNGPSILVSNQQDPHCNGAATGSASVNVAGSALPLSVLWSNGAMGTSVSGLVAGNYSAVVTDGNGCQSSVSLSLNQPNSISSLVSTNSTTCNAANGSILLNLSGGTLPYSVNWIGPTASTGMNPSGLLAGNYSATVIDAIGCTTSVSATVGTQTPPQVSVSEIQFISCPGGNDAELTVQITGGLAPFAVLWSTGETSSSIQSLSAGNYSTTITDASGCVTTATSVVSEPLSWSVQASLISSTCGNPNGSIQLNISGGTAPYVINWSNNQTGTFANQLLAGTYEAIITDAFGCISSSSHTVSDAGGLQLSVVSQSDAQCFGSNDGSAHVQAMGGTAPYVYHWFDGFNSAQRSDLSAGTHIVTVTDANGCSASTQILISEPTILDGILSINDGTCGLANGSASIQVNGGTLPYFYSWTNSSVLATIAGIPSGSIGVLVTDANGCQKNFSGSVGMAPALQLTANVTHPITCFGSSTGEIQLSGGSNLTVNWSTGQTGMTLSNVSAGTYTA
ncbi:MAG TPA: PKD domain-containing protein, partial [Flavobacteriales bacterium]|nr:PKD domain-containing protein [Flavobacteriales bacterium]